MKFLHTSDWQVGMKALRCGASAPKIREERLAAGQRVVEAANANGAEFLLLAGDLFEDNAVDRSLVRNASATLNAFRGRVFVIPGNHDPLTPGSVWDDPCWHNCANVTVLREPTPVELPGGTLFPCPALTKHSMEDPTAWISAKAYKNTICVGVAHGSVDGIGVEDMEYPIPLDAAQRSGLDYLALGHWHSTNLFPGPNNITRMAYSGSPETTAFGERDSGKALLVEITEPGAPPKITPVRTGDLAWMSITREIITPKDLKHLRKEIEEIIIPGRTILELTLKGLLSPEMQTQLDALGDVIKSKFLFGQMNTCLRPSPTDDSWCFNLPPGVIRDAAERLREMASAPEQGENSEVAAMALLELYAISHEVQK